TIGGFAATRSSGQDSAGYGRFNDMVRGLRTVTPAGVLDLGRAPESAAGPDLRQLMIGSEGVFGIITRVRVRVHPVPESTRYEAWSFPDFATGADALRAVVQTGAGPTVIRLSDEAETGVTEALTTSLAESGTPALVLCHISHVYPTGASLYFTVVAGQRGNPIEQWRKAKAAASDAMIRTGATITHHHAVGADHRPWMRAEVGDLGVAVLRAVKATLDPA